MNKSKFNKGYTLIELLVIILIMGIIFAIAIPSILKSIEAGKTVYISNLKEQLVLAAQDYYSSNEEELPRGQIVNGDEIKTSSLLYVSELESENYLSNEVIDPSNGSCSKSFILVTNDDNEFNYRTCLKCDNEEYNTKAGYCDILPEIKKDYQAPECVISYEDGYEPGTWSKEPITAIFTGITDDLHDIVKIRSFENRGVSPYEIHNGITYKETFDKSTLLDFWVYDNNGKTSQCIGDTKINSNEIKIDNNPPSCIIKMEQQNTNNEEYKNDSWTKYDVKVSWECSDGESGLKSESKGSKVFTGTGKHDFNLEVYDNVGNSKIYSKTIKIDQTNPSCGSVIGESTIWTNDNRYISVGCDDKDGSGCSKDRFGYNYKTSGKISYKTITDNVGNETKCPVKKYIDKTDPICGDIIGERSYWSKYNKTITVSCSDSLSGCEKSSFTTLHKNNGWYGYNLISDKAGNTTSCKVVKGIDKTAPTCIVDETTKDKWVKYDTKYQSYYANAYHDFYKTYYKRPVTLLIKCWDNLSGLSTSSNYDKTASSVSGHVSTWNTVSYSAKDKAGNAFSGSEEVMVYSKTYAWHNRTEDGSPHSGASKKRSYTCDMGTAKSIVITEYIGGGNSGELSFKSWQNYIMYCWGEYRY